MVTHSNSISKVKQGGDERATKTMHTHGLGASEEANAVSPMKWNWNQDAMTTETMPLTAAKHPQDKQRGALKTKRDEIDPAERLIKPNWIRVKAA